MPKILDAPKLQNFAARRKKGMVISMSMSIGKRQIVLATLVVALGAAVFVNWYYTKPDAEKANTGVTVTEEVTQAAGNLGDALLVNSSVLTE